MKTLIISLVLILSACAGKDGHNGSQGIQGAKGIQGATGATGQTGASGYQELYDKTKLIYSKHRQSVYRIVIQCNAVAIGFGSGFKISETQIATNKHVVNLSCPLGQVKRFLIQAVYSSLDTLEGSSSGLYGNGDCYASDVTSKVCTFSNSFVTSANYDLAKITIASQALVGSSVVLASSNEASNLIQTGAWNLSLSFPLGFEDLYTLLGQISTNYIGDCHGGSSYGCPGLDYDFSSTNDTDHGSSGSPIFDLNIGKVIGVTTAGTDGENMNTTWAIYAYNLLSF